MAEIEGLVNANAMTNAADQTGESGTSITERVNSLLTDIYENLPDALQGEAKDKLDQGHEQFQRAMEYIIRWCRNNETNLTLGNQKILTTDDLSGEEFQQAANYAGASVMNSDKPVNVA